MGNVYSNSPSESIRLSDIAEQMLNFNNLFQEGVPKMLRVADDLHIMVDYIRELRSMKTWELYIQLALLTIIGIFIFFILKYPNGKQKRRRRSNRGKYRFNVIRSEHSSIGNRYMKENSDAFMSKVHLFDDVLICGECSFRTNDIIEFTDHKSRECSNITKRPSEPKSIHCCENTFESSWKLLQHLTDKHNLNLYRDASTTDDCQERRSPQPPSPLSSQSIKSEENHPTALIMNNDHVCIPNLQSTIPMPTTPTAMPYYSGPTADAPPLTTSVSTTATPSVSSYINSEDPNMLKAQVFVGNLNASRDSREMLCNENSPILSDSTDAREMSKDYCNGEIVDEEKQTYTYDKKPIAPTTTTSTTSRGFNGLNKNVNLYHYAGSTVIKGNKIVVVKQSANQKTSNKKGVAVFGKK